MNLANTEEVYLLWDSADDSICNVDIPHQVGFEILFHTEDDDKREEDFGISYQGEIVYN